MPSPLTRFILESESKAPDEEQFELALQKLSKLLLSEMRRRGLYSAPPRFLGVVGHSFRDKDTFTDLLYDCYVFAILDRLSALQRRAKTGDIDGAVRLNMRLFLFERQRQQDPVGFRVFEIAREAVTALLESGDLEGIAGFDGRRVLSGTLLSFDGAKQGEPQPISDETVANWCEILMPDLVTAFHRQPVIQKLSKLILKLPSDGVLTFMLRDIVGPMKTIVRQRAVALLTEREFQAGGEPGPLDFAVGPPQSFEEREALTSLLRNLKRSIERRLDAKERNYLHRLLDFLSVWSAMMDDGSVRGRPSDSELSRQLDIPRERIPKLLATLGEMVSSSPVETPVIPQEPMAVAAREAVSKLDFGFVIGISGGAQEGSGGTGMALGSSYGAPELVLIPDLQGDQDSGKQVAFSPIQQHATIELVLDGDIESFEKERFQKEISDYLGAPVKVAKVLRGSIRVFLELEPELAEELFWRAKFGRLDLSFKVSRVADLMESAKKAILDAKKAEGRYDVFLCHNSRDKSAAKDVAQSLAAEWGIRSWIDDTALRAGDSWIEVIQDQLVKVPSAAVFLGSGSGPWQNAEMKALVYQFVEEAHSRRVIPVLLPTSARPPELPMFLRGTHYIDLLEEEPDPIESLALGIKNVDRARLEAFFRDLGREAAVN